MAHETATTTADRRIGQLAPAIKELLEGIRSTRAPCERCRVRPAAIVRVAPAVRALCRLCATTETLDREVARQRAVYASMRFRNRDVNRGEG